MELPNLLWNSVDISIMELHIVYIMELHNVDDGSPQIVWSFITANYKAPWIELWVMDLHKSNDMELHNSISINPIMEANNSITEIHKSSMEIRNELWISMINHRAPWMCFPFWDAILQPVLTITMNKMRKNETQLMNEHKIDMRRYK